jgi:hypothetical protein
MLTLDPLERFLFVGASVRRPTQDDELERLEVHAGSVAHAACRLTVGGSQVLIESINI